MMQTTERENAALGSDNTQSTRLIIGRNAVGELLKTGQPIDRIYVQEGEPDGSLKVIVAKASARRIPVLPCRKQKLAAMAGETPHQGVIAVAAEKEYCDPEDILEIAAARGEMPLVVIADCIADPHNLGALIRNCESAGVHGIILPRRRSAGLTGTVSKTSAGALEHMAIARVSNLSNTVEDLKKRGLWIVGCEIGGTKYTDISYDMPLALVMGSEGDGISKRLLSLCDFVATIPMRGKVNSLNVSSASAVLLYEILRSRDLKKPPENLKGR